MKKFFLPLLLLLSVLGLTQSAEKLRSLTQSNTGWEDYRAAGKLLYHTFGNLFSSTNPVENTTDNSDKTEDSEPNPIIFVSANLSNSIVISKIPGPALGFIQTLTTNQIKPWLIPVYDCFSHQQTDRGPDPSTGFRIFMEIVERCLKPNFAPANFVVAGKL